MDRVNSGCEMSVLQLRENHLNIRRYMTMKEKIEIADYAQTITKALPKGILLNTQGEKFNSMVIGWGNLGTTWGGVPRLWCMYGKTVIPSRSLTGQGSSL